MGVPPAAISKSRRRVNSCFRKKPAAAAATAALQRTSTKPNPTRNRMDRRAPKWGELPALAISNIYDYLDVNDVHIASSTCWHWRSVLFQKRFFKNFKFKLNVANDRQCNFFLQSLINLTSELTIIFDVRSIYHINKVKRILNRVSKSDHLTALRFHTKCMRLGASGSLLERDAKEIEQIFFEPIKMLLSRRFPSFKKLDLGCIETLALYATEFMKALSRPQDLKEITFASIKYDPSHYPIQIIEPILFEKCTSLQVLSLDYDTLNDEFLKTLRVLPLKKFMICVHGLDETHPGISENAWSEFSSRFETIDLILTLIYAYEAVDVLQHQIFRRSMPLSHLRVLFCNLINIDALDLLSRYFTDTLKSIQWIDSAFQEMDRNVMDLYLRSGQDPFVMMSWRCKLLEEIVIHGYVLDPHNLVGVSRLRGRSLKRLEVSMLDPPVSEMMNSFIEEISTQLGHKWRPQDSNTIHPALGYVQVSEDVRDEYVSNVIRADLAN
ncbi:F-box only protein 33 isoform X1 [Hermetia illucens]|nr:F-box only protein 33 isoform X1 [Hermetia illucens]XP_037905215.1 F-box only protein 33 isoform X1 [Hermetia illucens]